MPRFKVIDGGEGKEGPVPTLKELEDRKEALEDMLRKSGVRLYSERETACTANSYERNEDGLISRIAQYLRNIFQ